MRATYKGFVRNPDGSWKCIADSTIKWSTGSQQVTPGDRFVPGVKLMNVDLAALLDALAGFAPYQSKHSPDRHVARPLTSAGPRLDAGSTRAAGSEVCALPKLQRCVCLMCCRP
jgi:hypothetical protein